LVIHQAPSKPPTRPFRGNPMRRLRDEPSTSEEISSSADAKPLRPTVCARARVELPPARGQATTSRQESPAKPGSRWARAFEILRWRGPGRFLLLSLRELLKPLVYWHVYYIIQNEMQPALATPAVQGKFEISVYSGEQDLAKASTTLAGVGELTPAEIALRLQRQDAVAVAFAGEQAIGYLWMTFCSGLELAFDAVWTVHPKEAVLYDTFVLPGWRGRGLHACMDVALNNWAYPRGIVRAFASISALNNQSLGVLKLAGKARIMTLVLVRVRGLDRTWIKATGGPFNLYFERKQHPG
jgi:GNAT superfamily N-acetyltransferase